VNIEKQAIQGRTRKILGIRFFTDAIDIAVAQAMQGGLVLAPSGPGLAVDLVNTKSYRDAVAGADLVLVDSSALTLFWLMFSGESLQRISGLKFLRALVRKEELKKRAPVFWVMPSDEESRRNMKWLKAHGYEESPDNCYVAPRYSVDSIVDFELLRRIEAQRPKVVMIAIGGGIQEPLGHFLSRNLSYRPTIFCLGAAIAFLTGGQANIPRWGDALMLGWLFRIMYSPRRYAKRYWKAWALFPLLWSNRENMPPLKG
jgi:N-acetylglucosaminyldiphosphoundecaprenol N-acetyl-beta-D-mannosaminyltransferase